MVVLFENFKKTQDNLINYFYRVFFVTVWIVRESCNQNRQTFKFATNEPCVKLEKGIIIYIFMKSYIKVTNIFTQVEK